MIIEYKKDTKDNRPGRRKTIKKGTRKKVTPEYGNEQIKLGYAFDISEKQEEFEKQVFKKNDK